MHTFKSYITESSHPPIDTMKNTVDLQNPATVDDLNRALAAVLTAGFVTPYSAYEKISKVLIGYNLQLPQTIYMAEPEGEEVFALAQFGDPFGINFNDNGIAVGGMVKPGNGIEAAKEHGTAIFLYFSYELCNGYYDCCAIIVDQAGLSAIMDEDFEEDDTIEEGWPHGYHKGQYYDHGIGVDKRKWFELNPQYKEAPKKDPFARPKPTPSNHDHTRPGWAP